MNARLLCRFFALAPSLRRLLKVELKEKFGHEFYLWSTWAKPLAVLSFRPCRYHTDRGRPPTASCLVCRDRQAPRPRAPRASRRAQRFSRVVRRSGREMKTLINSKVTPKLVKAEPYNHSYNTFWAGRAQNRDVLGTLMTVDTKPANFSWKQFKTSTFFCMSKYVHIKDSFYLYNGKSFK